MRLDVINLILIPPFVVRSLPSQPELKLKLNCGGVAQIVHVNGRGALKHRRLPCEAQPLKMTRRNRYKAMAKKTLPMAAVATISGQTMEASAPR